MFRYIGGTLNYMGSGNLNMEYPYDNNPNHYNLWKPSNGYFPRGEAPPPYEEAVALAQAEAMNSQCTMRYGMSILFFSTYTKLDHNHTYFFLFSMSNVAHRPMPTNICTMETPCDLQPNITTNTTNLINININNAGNITTVASGENHQINKSYR